MDLDLTKILAFIIFPFAVAFLLNLIVYGLSGLSGQNQDYSHSRGFLPLVYLTIWFTALGFSFVYNNDATNFLRSHKYILILLSLFCIAFGSLYFFKCKFKFFVEYSLITIACYCFTGVTVLLKTTFLKELSVESLIFLSLISLLFEMGNVLENMNSKISSENNHWLFPYWKTIKVYILRIEE